MSEQDDAAAGGKQTLTVSKAIKLKIIKTEPRVTLVNSNGKSHPSVHLKRPQEAQKIKLGPSYPISLTKELQPKPKTKIFQCRFCFRVCTRKSSFTRHLQSHVKGNHNQCHICGKFFSFKCRLDQHLRCHTGEKPFKCNICFKAFTRKSHSMRHKRYVNCKEKSTRRSRLAEQLSLNNDYLFCNLAFVSKSELLRHMQIRFKLENKKWYFCVFYKKDFSWSDSQHIRTSEKISLW